jgi:predicted KAP-like P-loop ATPase
MSGHSISIPVSEVVTYGQEHGKFGAKEDPPESRTLDSDGLKQIEELLLMKIRGRASEGSLLGTHLLRRTLHLWAELGTPEEVRVWVESATSTDDALQQFLKEFESVQRAQSIGDHFVRSTYRLDPEWVRPYIDPDKVIQRIRAFSALGNEDLYQPAKQFVVEYDMRASGLDPDARDSFKH